MYQRILNAAVEKIDKLDAVSCEIRSKMIFIGGKIDISQIAIQQNKTIIEHNAYVKQKIVPSEINNIVIKLQHLNNIIVIADYITPRAKELLRFQKISYADTAGNMYIINDKLYVYIQTKNTNRDKVKTKTRAFNKAGLKVIYQFLQNPEFLNKTYRYIGEKAEVTIATVGVVLKDLLREKYIIKLADNAYKFTDRKKLFTNWVNGYLQNLRPKLRQKRFKWVNKDVDWRKLKLPENTLWGGAAAAEKLTQYLIADDISIYSNAPLMDLMQNLKIIPDDEGNITITETFGYSEHEENQTINPMIIYADLLADGQPRYIETANKIYKEYVEYRL